MSGKVQGPCLVGGETWRYMRSCFDSLRPKEREILRNSKFNLCTACFESYLFQFGDPGIAVRAMEEAVETGDYEKLRLDAGEAYRKH